MANGAQAAEKVEQEAEQTADEQPEEVEGGQVFTSPWQKAIENEGRPCHREHWHDGDIPGTVTWVGMGGAGDEEQGRVRGRVGLALSEDGTQIVLTVAYLQANHPGSDMAGLVEIVLSLPEAEALGMALLVRRPGKLSSDYGGGFAAQALQIPDPVG